MARDREARKEQPKLVFEDPSLDRLDARDLARHLGHHAGHSSQAIHPHRAECFKICLQPGARRAVGAGDAERDGWANG